MKKTIYKHHPVMFTEGLLATGEDWAGQTMLEVIPALLDSGSLGAGAGDYWGTLYLEDLCNTQSIDVPVGAGAIILEVDVREADATANPYLIIFGYDGCVSLANFPGRSFPVYCAPLDDRWTTSRVIIPLIDAPAIIDYLVSTSGGSTFDYRIRLIGWVILGEAYVKPTGAREDLACAFWAQ